MSFRDYLYEMKVIDERSLNGYSDDHYIESGVLAFVYTAGTKTLATLYSDANQTALANPITRAQFAASGGLKFYSGQASVDIFLADDKGNCAFHESLTDKSHVLPLNRSSVRKHFIAPFSAITTETDTGLDFPKQFLIQDVQVEVVTIDATETIDVGLLSTESGGDANGLLAAASVGTAGLVDNITVTAGSTETHISAHTYGALLDDQLVTGSNAAADHGLSRVKPHRVTATSAKSLVYNCSAGSDTAAGYIHAFGEQLR